ncbi:rhodanese-like domain-containing protein [Jatrophihabitans sp. DSM 45814]
MHPAHSSSDQPTEISARAAAELTSTPGEGSPRNLLLDVREADEWAAGHAPQAVHIPMSELNSRSSEIPTDQTIICVCHVGGRSAVVADALNRAGWTALNLTGGMNAWEDAGLPVVR